LTLITTPVIYWRSTAIATRFPRTQPPGRSAAPCEALHEHFGSVSSIAGATDHSDPPAWRLNAGRSAFMLLPVARCRAMTWGRHLRVGAAARSKPQVHGNLRGDPVGASISGNRGCPTTMTSNQQRRANRLIFQDDLWRRTGISKLVAARDVQGPPTSSRRCRLPNRR